MWLTGKFSVVAKWSTDDIKKKITHSSVKQFPQNIKELKFCHYYKNNAHKTITWWTESKKTL